MSCSVQEVVADFDFGAEENVAPELLMGCVTFLRSVRGFAPGSNLTKTGPQAALSAFLSSIEQHAGSLPAGKADDTKCLLVPLMPGGNNIVRQIEDHWVSPKPDRAWALSPFFDDNEQLPAQLKVLQAS